MAESEEKGIKQAVSVFLRSRAFRLHIQKTIEAFLTYRKSMRPSLEMRSYYKLTLFQCFHHSGHLRHGNALEY